MEDREVVLKLSYEVVMTSIVQVLGSAGFRAVPSFDLRAACSSLPDCICPHHGMAACDCEYCVLLIYDDEGRPPLSLVVHGHEGYSWLLLADTPSENIDVQFCERVMQVLSPESFLAFEGD